MMGNREEVGVLPRRTSFRPNNRPSQPCAVRGTTPRRDILHGDGVVH